MDKITLATLKQATAQQVFEQGALHLIRQNEKSMGFRPEIVGHEVCLYKGPENKVCAAGCFISDDEYQPHMEGMGWDEMVSEGLAPAEHSNLIMEMQTIHDGSKVCNWRDDLKTIGDKFNLDTTFIYQFEDGH